MKRREDESLREKKKAHQTTAVVIVVVVVENFTQVTPEKNTTHLSLRQGEGFSLHKSSVGSPSKNDYARL
jgi:hypothetical protein